MSQGELTFEDAGYEPISALEVSCDWTQLVTAYWKGKCQNNAYCLQD